MRSREISLPTIVANIAALIAGSPLGNGVHLTAALDRAPNSGYGSSPSVGTCNKKK